jgi:hypothetical protein
LPLWSRVGPQWQFRHRAFGLVTSCDRATRGIQMSTHVVTEFKTKPGRAEELVGKPPTLRRLPRLANRSGAHRRGGRDARRTHDRRVLRRSRHCQQVTQQLLAAPACGSPQTCRCVDGILTTMIIVGEKSLTCPPSERSTLPHILWLRLVTGVANSADCISLDYVGGLLLHAQAS